MKIFFLIILAFGLFFNCAGPYNACVNANKSKEQGTILAVAGCTSSNKSLCDGAVLNVLINEVNYPVYCDGTEK